MTKTPENQPEFQDFTVSVVCDSCGQTFTFDIPRQPTHEDAYDNAMQILYFTHADTCPGLVEKHIDPESI